MVMAFGPFTTTEDLSYAPLTELLTQCRANPPDVLLLAGPFVDALHPEIASGRADDSFDDIFQTQVRLLH